MTIPFWDNLRYNVASLLANEDAALSTVHRSPAKLLTHYRAHAFTGNPISLFEMAA